jgi:hypothetical protein
MSRTGRSRFKTCHRVQSSDKKPSLVVDLPPSKSPIARAHMCLRSCMRTRALILIRSLFSVLIPEAMRGSTTHPCLVRCSEGSGLATWEKVLFCGQAHISICGPRNFGSPTFKSSWLANRRARDGTSRIDRRDRTLHTRPLRLPPNKKCDLESPGAKSLTPPHPLLDWDACIFPEPFPPLATR